MGLQKQSITYREKDINAKLADPETQGDPSSQVKLIGEFRRKSGIFALNLRQRNFNKSKTARNIANDPSSETTSEIETSSSESLENKGQRGMDA